MDYRLCKIKYLMNVNSWLMGQCQFMYNLTQLGKKALIENLQPICKIVQLRMKLQDRLQSHNKQLSYITTYESVNDEKFRNSIEFCRTLTEFYKHKVLQLNQSIYSKENQLQKQQKQIKDTKYQQQKHCEQKNQIQQLFHAVKIYPRLIKSYKCQNINFLNVLKKPIIENQTLKTDLDEKQQLNESFDRKAINQQYEQSSIQTKINSPYLENVILCIKKKQFISKKLKQQIISLKGKLNTKNAQNKVLKDVIYKIQKSKIQSFELGQFSMSFSTIYKKRNIKLIQDAQDRQNLAYQQVWEDLPKLLLDS